MDTIRVALVDDHEIVRLGLRNLIDRQPDLQVSVECSTGEEAIRAIPHQADVAVLDIRLPDVSGLDVCRRLRAEDPDLPVIMLTSFGTDDLVSQALDAGAAGYLLKETRGPMLLEGIRTVAQGGSLFSPSVTAAVFHRLRDPGAFQDPVMTLSPQEQQVLQLIADGKTNREIGEHLFLSEKTVKHYVSSVLSKLGYARRSEAAAHWARYQAARNPAQ